MSRDLTSEQQAAVERRREALFVPANAGSGKTTVLVERFVRAVLDDEVPVDGILAITFTDKAAAELKSRIRRRFLDLGEREHARDAERAWISTIHGFCSRILRRHALAARLDPEYRVLEEGEAARLGSEAFDDALEAFLTGPGQDRLDLAAARTPSGLEGMVRAVHERLRSRGQERPELPEREPPVPAGEHAALKAAVAAALRSLDGVDGKKVSQAVAKLERCDQALDALGELELGVADEFAALLFAPSGAKALDIQPVHDVLKGLDAYVDACRARDEHAQYVLLRELLSLYAERYAEAKRKQSALDFEDLQLQTLELLRREPALCARYRDRFAHVLVDEFQDTNQLQVDLIELVAPPDGLFTVGDELQSIYGFRNADVAVFNEVRGRAAQEGRVAPLTANWRSDPEILRALNLGFGDVFESFAPLEPPPEGSRSVEQAEPLVQLSFEGDPAPVESGPPPVELLVVDRDAGRWKEKIEELELGEEPFGPSLAGIGQPWRAAEMRLLAARVKRLLDEEGFRPGEVVVLTRAAGDLPRYERALEERGIKTYLAGGSGYWSQQQVADLRAYLSVLANPLDEESLYFVLGSPLVGASLDALASIGLRAKRLNRDVWWTLEQGLCADGDGSDGLAEALGAEAKPIAEFVDRLRAERASCARLPLETLIDRVVTDSGYDRAVLRLPSGIRRLANVRKLMRLAREYEAERGRDVRGFIDFVDEQDLVSRREGEAPLEAAELGAVRLMTIHGAKGLEFPVVCVADLGREGRGDEDALRITPDGRVGLEIASLGGGKARRSGLDDIRKEQEDMQDAEERRVFYVGMTRAERRLILSGALDLVDLPPAKPLGVPYDWIWRAIAPGLADAVAAGQSRFELVRDWEGLPARVSGQLLRPADLTTVLPPPDRVPSPDAARAGSAPTAPLREFDRFEAQPALPVSRLSYSGLSRYRSCGYRFYLEKVVQMPPLGAAAQADRGGPPDPPGSDELAPLLRGTVVHELLERTDFAQPAAPSDEQIAERLAAHGADAGPVATEDVRRLVSAFERSPLCGRLAVAKRVRRELAFAYELVPPGAAGRSLLANGFVDAHADEEDGVLIVDYKTDGLDGVEPEELCARSYSVQRLVYALAALRSGAARVEVAYCFLERPEEPVSATWTAADADALERELLELAGGVIQGHFEPTAQPHRDLCVECPGRTRLCSWPQERTLEPLVSAP